MAQTIQKLNTLDAVIKKDFGQEKWDFYRNVIIFLRKNKFPFMIGGGLAVREYAPSIGRMMKDLDIFVKAGDYPKIINLLHDEGFKAKIIDERWLAKATLGKHYADFIFASPNYMNPVDDTWFTNARPLHLFGFDLLMISPEDLIWCKSYIQDRSHYDGADINHIIYAQGATLDWKKLLGRMEYHWELLFGLILNFRFVYPSDRGPVPKWLLTELIERLESQLKNPIPQDKINRGLLISRNEYLTDFAEENFNNS